MNEKELLQQFSDFGYHVEKLNGSYSVFDRRVTKRIMEVHSFEALRDYAENIFIFPIRLESLKATIKAFREMFSPVTKPAEPVPVTGKKEASEPDPEQESSPVPETPLFEKVCPSCGKTFQTPIKQRKYCSENCYPSEMKKQRNQRK